jgi:neutral ceramidase
VSYLTPARPQAVPTGGGRAGVARVDITAPIGAPLIGFAGRGPATGVLDPLTATALFVVSRGGDSVAVVACDLEGIDAEWTDQVQEGARRATGIPGLHVLVSCSHTHYAPAGPTMDNEGPLEHPLSIAYTQLLVHDLVGAIALAAGRARPCTVRSATGESRVGINRRERLPDGRVVLGHNPDGPCDSRVLMIVIEADDGAEIATVVNFACHPVSLGGSFRNLSADFVGPFRDTVEKFTGHPVIFLQGAAGDINPRTMGVTVDTPLDTALPLAAEVVRLHNAVGGSPPEQLAVHFSQGTYHYAPLLPDTEEAAQREVDHLEDELRALNAGSAPDPGELSWTELRLERATEALEVRSGRQTARPIEARQYALTLTPGLAIATAPCELFNVLGSEISDRSPFPTTLFCGYVNGLIGYVPTRQAYSEGGYEVTHATLVAPGVGEEIADNAVSLLQSLGRHFG